ncbi:hypothetical protein KBC03_03725 [Patescibacteria group bacterium]|nr:hypothetical protein [Patescibacteria group bacterium]
MIKKIVTAAFIVAFGLAMTNVTFANHAEDVMCTAHYQPVCGEVQVQCITAPCYPVQQTFGNRCEAERAHAMNIQDGTCDSQSQTLVNTDRKLTSFNDQAVNDAATVSFGSSTLSAKVCNSKSASYSVSGNVLQV